MLNTQWIKAMYREYTTATWSSVVPLNTVLSTEWLDSYKASGQKMATAPGATCGRRMLGRGIEGAQLAARVPASFFVVPDLILGTGINPTPKLDLDSAEGREKHFRDIIHHPTSTGLAGLVLGAEVAFVVFNCAAIGAMVGAVIGLANAAGKNFMHVEGGAFHGIVQPAICLGATAGAALGCIWAAKDAFLLTGVRLVVALAKLFLMLPFAAVGFVAGASYGLSDRKSSQQPMWPRLDTAPRVGPEMQMPYAPPPMPPPDIVPQPISRRQSA